MSQTTGIAPGSARAWLLTARPATLTVGMVPVLVGTAVAHAHHGVNLWSAFAALLGATFIQIGTNFSNDVADFERGADNENRLGPTRATQAGLLRADQVRNGMWFSFFLAALAGLYLISVGGWPILVVGLLSILSGIGYTGGPFPFGYRGLGDLFVFVFFGFVAVCGTTYVQLGQVPALSWWASLPVGALATAVLVVNNVRDRSTDELAGKRTLVVRFGHSFGILEYNALIVLSYLVPVGLVLSGMCSRWALLPLVTLPQARRLVAAMASESGAALNPRLGETARLLLFFGLLFALGLSR